MSSATTMNAHELFGFFSKNLYRREALDSARSGLQTALTPNAQIIIAAMPKTGSTLLFYILGRSLGRVLNMVSFTKDGSDECLYFPLLACDSILRQCVCKMHLDATESNLAMLNAFNITPVVQVRHLLDVIVSARDHHLLAPTGSSDNSPFGHGFRELSSEAQLDVVIDLQTPRYLEFYRSWFEAEREGEIRLCWVAYEKLIAEKASEVSRVMDFLGVSASDEAIEKAIQSLDPSETRFNKGVNGRGALLLSDRQKQRVESIARHYRNIDFTRLGLPIT